VGLSEALDARAGLLRALSERGPRVFADGRAIGDHADPIRIRVVEGAGHDSSVRREAGRNSVPELDELVVESAIDRLSDAWREILGRVED
jgi:hypothetical protein